MCPASVKQFESHVVTCSIRILRADLKDHTSWDDDPDSASQQAPTPAHERSVCQDTCNDGEFPLVAMDHSPPYKFAFSGSWNGNAPWMLL